jgi:hypothetical protein
VFENVVVKSEKKGYTPPQMYTEKQIKDFSKLAVDTLCAANSDGTNMRKKMKSQNLHTYKKVLLFFCIFTNPHHFFYAPR